MATGKGWPRGADSASELGWICLPAACGCLRQPHHLHQPAFGEVLAGDSPLFLPDSILRSQNRICRLPDWFCQSLDAFCQLLYRLVLLLFDH
jgi:hypothetical protein